MTYPKTNPATRLLLLLRDALQAQNSERANVVWGRILGCDPDDEILLLSRLESLQGLWIETVSAVHQHTDDQNRGLYTRSFEPIRRAISALNLSAGWEQYHRYLTPEVLLGLEHVADHLRRVGYVDEQRLQGVDEKLSALDRDVAALVNDVQNSAFEPPLRQYLLDGLEAIRRGIAEYRIRGAEGLDKALRASLGSLFYVGTELQDKGQGEGDRDSNLEILRRWVTTLKEAGEVVQLALKVPQVLAKLLPYLPALPQP